VRLLGGLVKLEGAQADIIIQADYDFGTDMQN
jgi:hypothetical protein